MLSGALSGRTGQVLQLGATSFADGLTGGLPNMASPRNNPRISFRRLGKFSEFDPNVGGRPPHDCAVKPLTVIQNQLKALRNSQNAG
jgi:hypothetical protein